MGHVSESVDQVWRLDDQLCPQSWSSHGPVMVTWFMIKRYRMLDLYLCTFITCEAELQRPLWRNFVVLPKKQIRWTSQTCCFYLLRVFLWISGVVLCVYKAFCSFFIFMFIGVCFFFFLLEVVFCFHVAVLRVFDVCLCFMKSGCLLSQYVFIFDIFFSLWSRFSSF